MAFNNTLVARAAAGIWGLKLGNATTASVLAQSNTTPLATLINNAFNASYGTTSNSAIADVVVANLGLTGTAAVDGKAYLLAQLTGVATTARGSVIAGIVDQFAGLTGDATYGAAALAFNARVANAAVYSNTVGTQDAPLVELSSGTSFNLELTRDRMTGTAGNDLFSAFIFDNANTLQSGDFIDGGQGTDTLFADMGSSATFSVTPITRSVETIQIRAQSRATDSADNNVANEDRVNLDFERVSGVTRIESNNSRADVIVEDVRILSNQITRDITVAFVQSDPGNIDFGVYFDQPSLRADRTSSSSLVLQVIDLKAAGNAATAATPLLDAPYDGISFTLNGNLVLLQNNAINNATTYAALLSAVQAALASSTTPGVAGVVTAALGANFTVNDSQTLQAVTGQSIVLSATNATFGIGNWIASQGVPANSNLFTNQIAGASTVDDLVAVKVVLDDVGRGSTGGDLVIGGLSVGETSTSRGIDRFEITVERNSRLQNIDSTNNWLKEVQIVNSGTTSNLLTVLGFATANGGTGAGVVGNLAPELSTTTGQAAPLPGAVAQHDIYGFNDVRLIDASAFRGMLTFDAVITPASLAKYIITNDTAANPAGDNTSVVTKTTQVADFIYTGGSNNDSMTVVIDAGVAASRNTVMAGREDFSFNVNGGAGNDTITVTVSPLLGQFQNWYGNQKLNANIRVDGGDGNDTIRTPGAGDVIINGGAGTDTIYVDNTGTQALTSGQDSTAGLAYASASAAELASAIAIRTLVDNTDNAVLLQRTVDLNTLNLVTPVLFPVAAITKADIATATAAAAASGAITLAQKIALDAAYNARTGGTVTTPATLIPAAITGDVAVILPTANLSAAEFATGNALLETYIAAAKAANAAATSADTNNTNIVALLNATQAPVVTNTIAITGVLGTGTILAGLNTLKAALSVNATDVQVVAALQAAQTAGFITGGVATNLFNAAVTTPGTVDAGERDAALLILDPLVNTANNNNVAANATLNTSITANNTAVRTAAGIVGAEPVLATPSAVANDAVGSTESTAAASAAALALSGYNTATLNPAVTIQSDLATLRAALAVSTTDLAFSIATANAVSKGTIIAGDKTALDAAATFGATPVVGGTLDATEKVAVDLLLTALQLANETTVDSLRLVSAGLAANRDATATAAANALAASNNAPTVAFTETNARGTWVLNTADQSAVTLTPGTGYVLAVDDERNISDLRSDANNSHNLFAARLTVNFKGIESTVTVPSTAYRTTDLQINQAIKDAINNNVILNKLVTANDGPANSLIITSLIDGVMSEANFGVTLAVPGTGVVSTADVTAAAAIYGVAVTEAAVLAAMATVKSAFDSKGDYVDRLAESGSFGGNTLLTGAASTTTSDNLITPGSDNDVVVLGTTSSVSELLSSNDTVVFGAAFGNDTIVNFQARARATGGDVLNLSAVGGRTLTTAFNVDRSVNVAAEVLGTNGTAALVAALFTDSVTVQTHVFVAVDTLTNIAKIYTVNDAAGVGVGSVTAILAGTIDLADTLWSTLTADNFGS